MYTAQLCAFLGVLNSSYYAGTIHIIVGRFVFGASYRGFSTYSVGPLWLVGPCIRPTKWILNLALSCPRGTTLLYTKHALGFLRVTAEGWGDEFTAHVLWVRTDTPITAHPDSRQLPYATGSTPRNRRRPQKLRRLANNVVLKYHRRRRRHALGDIRMSEVRWGLHRGLAAIKLRPVYLHLRRSPEALHHVRRPR